MILNSYICGRRTSGTEFRFSATQRQLLIYRPVFENQPERLEDKWRLLNKSRPLRQIELPVFFKERRILSRLAADRAHSFTTLS